MSKKVLVLEGSPRVGGNPDVLVLSSPVYFYSFTAQMKTALDRFYAREAEVKNKE